MAIFDLESFREWLTVDSTGTVTKKTSKTYTVDNNEFFGSIFKYRGSFTYDSDGDVFGSLTSYTQKNYIDQTIMKVSDFKVNDNLISTLTHTELVVKIAAGADTFNGTLFDDEIYGFGGNDKLYGGWGDDLIYGGKGRDKLYGDDDKDKLYGGKGKDKLYGEKGKDKLYGDSGKDKLYGGSSKDTLKGGGGKDKLDGGKGNDKLFGGSGADTFVFNKKSGKDTIEDFGGNDVIAITKGANRMKDLDFTDTKAGLKVEFGKVDIFLEDLDRNDISSSDFDFG